VHHYCVVSNAYESSCAAGAIRTRSGVTADKMKAAVAAEANDRS